jgi:hypothetical protein
MKTLRPILAAVLFLASLLFVSCAGTNLTVTPDGYLMTKAENGVSAGFATDADGKIVSQRVEFENADGVKVRIDRGKGKEKISYLDPSGVWVGWEKDSGVIVTIPQAVPVEATK